jgi:LPXTG-motif cell wall-anchored protein
MLKEREAALELGVVKMEYPHWLIVAGAALLAIGFIGLTFRRNRDVGPSHEPAEMMENGKQVGRNLNADVLPPWPWRPPPQAG